MSEVPGAGAPVGGPTGGPQGGDHPDGSARRGPRGWWPYALILAGACLLVLNLGWVSWATVGAVLSLWPVLLLAVGADLLTRGRYRPAVAIGALLLAAVLWVGAPRGGETVVVDHPLGGASSAVVVLQLGVGEVNLDGNADEGQLIGGTIQTGNGETIQQTPSRQDEVARVEIVSRSRGNFNLGFGPTFRRSWNLSITPEVPINLRVEAGVGRSTFDLRRLWLRAFSYRGGVGEAIVTLPERGGYSASFDLGVGSTTLRVPRDVEARVTVSTGVGGVSVDGEFSQSGSSYTTAGYATAALPDRIELIVQGGVGAINLERMR